MADIELTGHQEAPRCPDNIQRRLSEFDARLRVVFNEKWRVWQVQEQLRQSGTWSHVFYWHDGPGYPQNAMLFRPLPASAEPLIVEVLKRDVTRNGGDVKALCEELDAKGATEHARRLMQCRDNMRNKLKNYLGEMRRNIADWQRRYNIGGKTRQGAIEERTRMLRDLGLR